MCIGKRAGEGAEFRLLFDFLNSLCYLLSVEFTYERIMESGECPGSIFVQWECFCIARQTNPKKYGKNTVKRKYTK